MSILFIGGASGSGKTTTALMLSQNLHVPILSIDCLYNKLSPILKEKALSDVTENIAFEMVKQLLVKDATAIVEGGWIQPERAKEIRDNYPKTFCAIFCGYPNIDAKKRQKDLKNSKSSHRLARNNSIEDLEQQIIDSKSYQSRAEKHGFEFCDFSNIMTGEKRLEELITNWLNQNRTP